MVLTTILTSALLFVGAFGFPNETGTEILVRHDIAQADADALRTAICGGRALPIRFGRRQKKPDDAAATRDTARAFNQLEGTVFRVLQERAGADETCFLAADALLKDAELLRVTPHASAKPETCKPDERQRFARLRTRAIKTCWTLATFGDGSIGVAEYQRADRDALASVIVASGDRGILIDFAAEDKGAGADLWRADDNGEFAADGFSVDFIIRRGRTVYIPVAWHAPEGVALRLFVAEATSARQMIADYWYRAPY